MGHTTKKAKKATKAKRTATKATKPRQAITGRTLGLNVRETWLRILKENATKKQTDAKLSAFIHAEFPDRKSFELTDPRGVRICRAAFNRGYFTGGQKPAKPSVPYDTNGRVIEGSRGSLKMR